MNPVNRTHARSPSPRRRDIDDEGEATETTGLLADHDGIHETSEEIEDQPFEPQNNNNEPNPAHNRLNPGHGGVNPRHNEPDYYFNEPNAYFDEPDDNNDNMQDVRNEGSAPFWSKWDNEKIRYRAFSAIPIFLLIPSLVFFIMTLSLKPPPSSLEVIENLTRRVSELSSSLTTCSANTTRLAIELHDEQQKFEVCHENERKLEERVDVVQGMLERCQAAENILKKNLETTQNELSVCHTERDELKKQMESAVYIQFLDMVGKMGTGGDSWVCSDKTELWSYGFTATEAPHSTIKIQTWTSELRDAEHSAKPLIFPPDPTAPIPEPTSGFQSRIQKRKISPSYSQSVQMRQDPPPRIIGYTVSSGNTSGNNGWWRISKLPAFGVEEGKIEFFAQAAQWYKSRARFRVTVFWV